MNVEQVIKELQKFPPEMEVRVWAGADCDYESAVDFIKQIEIWTPDDPKKQVVLIE